MNPKLRLSLVIFALTVLSVFNAHAQRLQDVPIGITPAMSTAGLFVAYEKGYFKEQGINLVMQQIPRAGAQMIPFLATGQLLVGCGNLNPGLYNAIANDIPLKVVADKGTVMPDHGYLALIVRKVHVDSGRYKNLKDLKGMTIALTARGVSQEIVVEKYLSKYYHYIDNGKVAINRGKVLTADDIARRNFVLPLKNDFLDKAFYREKIGMDANQLFENEIRWMKQLGMIEENDQKIWLSKRGGFFADEVATQFFDPAYIVYDDIKLAPSRKTLAH